MRRWRNRALTLFAVALHGAALTVLPVLHQHHHRADHVHLGAQTMPLAALLEAPLDHEELPASATVEDVHQAFDADLEAVALAEAGHFGIAAVDCSLAAYTLADCAAPDAPPHSFGDELVGRSHRHDPGAPLDPAHGLHSLEHLGLAVLGTPTFLLPPPSLPLLRTAAPVVALPVGATPALSLRARAPPAPTA